jgi:hypothetical protein
MSSGFLTGGSHFGRAKKRLTVLRTHVYQSASAVAKFFEINSQSAQQIAGLGRGQAAT